MLQPRSFSFPPAVVDNKKMTMTVCRPFGTLFECKRRRSSLLLLLLLLHAHVDHERHQEEDQDDGQGQISNEEPRCRDQEAQDDHDA